MSYYSFQPDSSFQVACPPLSNEQASAPSVVPAVRSLFSNYGPLHALETTNDAWMQPDTPDNSISHSPFHPAACPEAAYPTGSALRYNCSPDEQTSTPLAGAIHPPSTGPRRPRAAQACKECRAAKVRCCGKRPCERCQEKGLECRYKAKESPSIKKIVKSVVGRVNNYESMVNRNQAALKRMEHKIDRLETIVTLLLKQHTVPMNYIMGTECVRGLDTTAWDAEACSIRPVNSAGPAVAIGYGGFDMRES